MNWRLPAFLLFLFVLLVGIHWADSKEGLCSSDFVIDVVKLHNKDGALNCADFWINRYQTLISALIAGGIAFWAARLLLLQTSAQNFDFYAKQISYLIELRAAGDEVKDFCDYELSSVDKIIGDEPKTGIGLMDGLWGGITSSDFFDNMEGARNAIEILISTCERPVGPLQAVAVGRELAQFAREYVKECERDYDRGWVYPPTIPTKAHRVTVTRSDMSRDKRTAFSEVWKEFAKVYALEMTDLKRRQARAHNALR